ncbi:rhamnosyltransferase [Sporomusaceae bacterium BoRhaA]|uniref:glycosyltransferase n=1 Tax=Pelorhabdus rhamnosifermentans TaxID=2772457 RepID=UPI001C061A01|nr:glycosyltransferase [Pelorhabdus rhamnosifermentans]MBU2699073.1 rhamnosyltransferase [Pelorhabdus rhamnosifermentans]
MSLAGVVILYNPEDHIINNINSYVSYVDVLYVIDNSDTVNEQLVKHLIACANVRYIKNKENMGIAYSLNVVLNKIQGNYTWLLTMDQDSFFYQRDIELYANMLKNFADKPDVVSVAPILVTEDTYVIDNNKDQQQVTRCITSGNIIKVKTAIEVGGFDEKLFIDEVDHEFCYRCNSKGYKIFKIKDIKLIHHMGNPTRKKFLGIYRYYPTNHNYIRDYYITRNMFYVLQKYPNVRNRVLINWIKRILKIVLAEDDKYRKIKSIFEGYKDYRNKKFGKKHFAY